MEAITQFLQLIKENGVGVVVIVALGFFGYFRLWPWWVSKDAASTAERTRVNDKLIDTLDGQKDTMSGMRVSLGNIAAAQEKHTGAIDSMTAAVRDFRCRSKDE